jgi:ferredoxin--NADP+ reductase
MHKGVHKVLSVEHLTEHTFSIRIERNDMKFTAGQCVNIGLPNAGVNREYSSYSGESEPELRFLIRSVEDGQVSSKLKQLKPGDFVEVDGSYGLFTLANPHDTSKEYVFVATGTGIAPFHCFVKSYPQIKYKIIHGTAQNNECYNKDDYAAGRYVHCVSKEAGGDLQGRVTDYLRKNPQSKNAIYYLCGNRNMINEVYDILREQDVSGTNIVTEVFF